MDLSGRMGGVGWWAATGAGVSGRRGGGGAEGVAQDGVGGAALGVDGGEAALDGCCGGHEREGVHGDVGVVGGDEFGADEAEADDVVKAGGDGGVFEPAHEGRERNGEAGEEVAGGVEGIFERGDHLACR
jgi:hypothetical protein